MLEGTLLADLFCFPCHVNVLIRRVNTTLTHLNLGNNLLKDGGVEKLCAALVENSTLTHLLWVSSFLVLLLNCVLMLASLPFFAQVYV